LALVSGAFGAVAATWWQTRHERREAWRTRLIEAADTFSQEAVKSYSASARALERLGHTELLAEAEDAYDAARAAAYRVDLLFGHKSDTSTEAWHFIDAIDDLLITMRETPEDSQYAGQMSTKAYLTRHRFVEVAHAAIRAVEAP
jgi:hypothetical protein